MGLFDTFVTKELRKSQKIIIKNIPQVTYEEVKSYLGKFAISNIAISKRLKHAIVDLKDGLEAEIAVDKLQGILLHGQKVEVSLFRKDNLLCITNLSKSVSHQDLKKFIEPLGAIEKYCVWIDNEGQSLGYAFFELQHNHDLSELVRVQIDGRIMDHRRLGCDFVKDSILSLEQFQSKVVVVTGWMEDVGHMDANQFARIALIADVPLFCEHVCHGGSTCYGVAEFKTSKSAIKFYKNLSKHRFIGHSNAAPLMEGVYFSCPGYTGEEVFRKVSMNLNFDANKKRPAQPLVNPRHLMSSNPTIDSHKDSHSITYPSQSIILTQPTQPLVFLPPQQVMCRQNIAFSQKPQLTYSQAMPLGYVQTTPLVYIPVTTYYGVMPVGIADENPFGIKTQMNDCGNENGQHIFKQNECVKNSAKENINKRKLWRPKIFDELRNQKKEIPPTVREIQNQNTNFLSRKRSYRESCQSEILSAISNTRGSMQSNHTQSITIDNQYIKNNNEVAFKENFNFQNSLHTITNEENSINSKCSGNSMLNINSDNNFIPNSVYENRVISNEINNCISDDFIVNESKSSAFNYNNNTYDNILGHNLMPKILSKNPKELIVDRTNIFDCELEEAPLLKKKKNTVFGSALGLCDDMKENVDVLPSTCKLAWLR